MGFFDDITDTLFGSKPKVEYAPQSEAQTEINKLLKQYLAQYSGQMTGATPVPTYTGQMTAGLTPLQTGSIANISGLQNLSQSGDVLSQIMKMVSGENFNPEYMRSDYKTGIEQPLVSIFKEDTMPGIRSAYSKGGLFYGSDKQKQTQDTASTLMDALAKGRTSLESNIYTAGLANQQQGISDFAQYLSSQGGLETLGMQAGAVEQATNQTDLTNKYNQWLRTQAGTMPTDDLLKAILSMYSGYGNQAVVTPGSSGALGPLSLATMALSGGGSGTGAGVSSLSSLSDIISFLSWAGPGAV